MEGDSLFKAFVSGGAASGDAGGLAPAGSLLNRYIGGQKKPTGAPPSPFEAGVHAPVFVPSTSQPPALDKAFHNLGLHPSRSVPAGVDGQPHGSSNDSAPYAFTPTSVNTNGHPALPPSSDYLDDNGLLYYYDGANPEDGNPAAAPPTYSGPPSYLAHYRPRGGAAEASYFASDEIRMTLMGRQHHRLPQLNPDLAALELPSEVGGYTNLVPLEPASKSSVLDRPGFFMSYPSTVYKAISSKDGLVYALRRIHNCRLLKTQCLTLTDMWRKLQHANLVRIHGVFPTRAFGDPSLVFVYDYHGGAETLKSRHFSSLSSAGSLASDGAPATSPPNHLPTSAPPPGAQPQTQPRKGLDEGFVWTYVIQLSSALRTIHAAGLAANTVDPSKILVTGRSKILLNCCGIMDVLAFEQTQANFQLAMHNFQQEELLALGRLILALCCGSLTAPARDQMPASVAYVTQFYSADLSNIVKFLLSPAPPGRSKNINEIMPMIGARFYAQLEAAQTRIDMLENELAKEVDNGRLFRLLCKLGTLNERPEFALDPAWAETGDRFLLKLFRDHLFHQVTPDGHPWLDLAHVVTSLNKLDAGVDEKVALASRDDQNLLLVSYSDLRRCLNGAFAELSSAAALALPPNSTLSSNSAQPHPPPPPPPPHPSAPL